MFMAGSVGATALLHQRQLGLFGMISRLQNNILHKICTSKLYSEPDNSSSWFVQIQHLCSLYNLPCPLSLLSHPPSKSAFKSLIRKQILDHWQQKFRSDSLDKPSLMYFKPQFMSLLRPHPLWTTSKSNSFETNKSIVVARLLSGRYRSDWHARHWNLSNKNGFCLLCPGKNIPGTIEHLLVSCVSLQHKRLDLFNFWDQRTVENPHLRDLMLSIRSSSITNFVQFVLDPSVVSSVISGCQDRLYKLEDIFHLTRTFCYALHRLRLQLLGRFNFAD